MIPCLLSYSFSLAVKQRDSHSAFCLPLASNRKTSFFGTTFSSSAFLLPPVVPAVAARSPPSPRPLQQLSPLEKKKKMVAPSSSTDLTSKLLPHLDRHLALPLLDFLENRGTYTHDAVLKAKYQLLLPTNMVTFVLGLKREIDGTTEEDAVVPQGQFQPFSTPGGRVLMDFLGG